MTYSSLWDSVEQHPYSLNQGRNRQFVNPTPLVTNPTAPGYSMMGSNLNSLIPTPNVRQLPGGIMSVGNNQFMPISTTQGNANGISAADVTAAFGRTNQFNLPQANFSNLMPGAGNQSSDISASLGFTSPTQAAPTTATVDPLAALRATELNMTPGVLANGQLDTGGILNTPTATTDTGGGIFSDMGGADWLGFGAGLLNTAVGGYFQNRQMNLAEDEFALAQQKFDTYLADRQRMLDADTRRSAASGG